MAKFKIDDFELALTQVTLPLRYSLRICMAGLEHNIQWIMFSPTSIAHAANLAKLHEASM